MHKDKALIIIQNSLEHNENLIGFFQAAEQPKMWLWFLIGPIATLAIKNYFVAVTNKGIHFHRLNLIGKFVKHDFLTYDEIEKIKLGTGKLQIPLNVSFKNGRKISLKAQKKGFSSVATIDEATMQYLKNIQ